MPSVHAATSSERFSKIKQILDTDLPEYDVVYSSLQYSDEFLAKVVEGINNKTHGRSSHLESHLGKEVFIYVRHAKDGYFTQYALSLCQRSLKTSHEGSNENQPL
jgi:hypothetical protein